MNQPACNAMRSIAGREATGKTYLDVEDLQVYQMFCQFHHLPEKERRWAVAETVGE